jgi:hypothetical protein
MHRITLTVAPGIWRHPEWILDEFERIAKKHRTTNLVDAINMVCQQQRWHFDYARTAGGAMVTVSPQRALPRSYDGCVDVDVPLDLSRAAAPVRSPAAQLLGAASPAARLIG